MRGRAFMQFTAALLAAVTAASCSQEIEVTDHSFELAVHAEAADLSQSAEVELSLVRGGKDRDYTMEWTVDGKGGTGLTDESGQNFRNGGKLRFGADGNARFRTGTLTAGRHVLDFHVESEGFEVTATAEATITFTPFRISCNAVTEGPETRIQFFLTEGDRDRIYGISAELDGKPVRGAEDIRADFRASPVVEVPLGLPNPGRHSILAVTSCGEVRDTVRTSFLEPLRHPDVLASLTEDAGGTVSLRIEDNPYGIGMEGSVQAAVTGICEHNRYMGPEVRPETVSDTVTVTGSQSFRTSAREGRVCRISADSLKTAIQEKHEPDFEWKWAMDEYGMYSIEIYRRFDTPYTPWRETLSVTVDCPHLPSGLLLKMDCGETACLVNGKFTAGGTVLLKKGEDEWKEASR